MLQTGATSVDFDQQEEKIYIASSNSIYRVNFNGSGQYFDGQQSTASLGKGTQNFNQT